MRRITSFTIISIIPILKIFASYSDYGRDYTMRESNSDTPLWFVIAVIVGIYVVSKLIYIGISTLDNKQKKINNKQSSTQEHESVKIQFHQCPNCHGAGFIKAGPVYSDYELCEYCHGYGKELNDNALKYLELIKDTNKDQSNGRELRKERLCFSYGIQTFLLEDELKKCPPCTHCNGKGKIEINTFYDMDERFNIVKYKRLPCPKCNGTGKYSSK